MSRIPAKTRISRRLGTLVLGSSKAFQRRPYPPGEHGTGRQPKKSEYALQMQEKQKVRFAYGLSERQLQNMVNKANIKRGSTAAKLYELLESRLDNLLYRSGFAVSRAQARQTVVHGQVRVGEKRVTIPSAVIPIGKIISINAKQAPTKSAIKPSWLGVNDSAKTITVTSAPVLDETSEEINFNQVIAFYSR